MSEQFANLANTTVGGAGYTAGSGVLNVASTGSPFPGSATFRVAIADQGSFVVKVLLTVTAINSGTQWAVTAETTDVNASVGDLVYAVLTAGAIAQLKADILAGGGSGTVTSVALTVPARQTVAGSPVTTSGTLAISDNNQSANQVFAGPSSGAAAAPGFRALVAADIPNIAESQVTNLATDLAAKVSTTRNVNTTAPLTGGGALSADLTLAVSNATASTVGVVKPDGTTITISGGVLTATASGSGTVTHTGGALTTDQPVFGAGGADIKVGTKTGNTDEVVTATGAATSGRPLLYDANGNAVGSQPRGNTTVVQLADSTASPTSGDLASFDASGNIKDSAILASSIVKSLTTTGTSGAATLSSGVLNVPQYASGSSGLPYTFTAPPGSGWSWQSQNVNGHVNTIDTSNSQLTITSDGAAGEGIASYVRTKIASTFTITAAISLAHLSLNDATHYSETGLVVTDGTKLIVLGWLIYNFSAGLSAFKWNTATSASAQVTGWPATTGSYFQFSNLGPWLFLRIQETASLRIFSMSSDFRNWISLSTANTDFLTTTSYGIFIRSVSVQANGTCFSFTETNP